MAWCPAYLPSLLPFQHLDSSNQLTGRTSTTQVAVFEDVVVFPFQDWAAWCETVELVGGGESPCCESDVVCVECEIDFRGLVMLDWRRRGNGMELNIEDGMG